MTLAEMPGPFEYGPLRIDADFKSTDPKRQYRLSNLERLVRIYQEEIQKIVKPENFEKKLLWCIVLEKKSPRQERGVFKDGFHIHFPHFICNAWTQDIHLRNSVTKRMTKEGVWAGCKFLTPLDQILDKGIAKKPWMLYGSMNYKGKTSSPYLYSYKEGVGVIFDDNQKQISLKKLFEDEMIGRRQNVRYYLPVLLEIRGFPEPTALKKGTIRTIRNHNKRKKPQIIRTKSEDEIVADLKYIQENEIMDLLKPERADSYDGWIRTGWTLFNIGQGHEKALQMWIDFSKKSAKFIEGECENEWSRMKLGSLGIGTLLWWAKHDSPDRYKANRSYGLKKLLWDCLYTKCPNEYKIAKVLYHRYRNRFRCAVDGSKDYWYEFKSHRWVRILGALSLKHLLPEEVADIFQALYRDIAETHQGEVKETYNKKNKTLIEALGTKCLQAKILDQFKLFVGDDKFLEKLDNNPTLIGCENGVLDLKQGVFRRGEPDDYISFSTGLNYFEYDAGEAQELNDYLKKTFPNPHLREYFLDFMCSCLQGGNIHKRFLVMTGAGDNGKSVTVELLESVFGEYLGVFPRALLIRGRGDSSGSARPDLVQCRGKRVMVCSEIGNGMDEVNVGVLKELTGKDSIFARGLFKDGNKFRPQFTFLLQCNRPPKIPADDSATWSRIRVLDYEAKFVKPQDLGKDSDHTVPEEEEEQMRQKKFMADPCFGSKLPDLAPILLWKLFQRHITIYKDRGLYEPPEVNISTERYKTSNDIYRQFIEERLEKIEEKEEIKRETISVPAMFREFREWHKANYPSYHKDMPGRGVVRDNLVRRMGGNIKEADVKTKLYGFRKRRWWGYRFVMQGEDEADESSLAEKQKELESMLG